MTTLKEALDNAKISMNSAPNGDWRKAFIGALDASGFVIAPKEATDEMIDAGIIGFLEESLSDAMAVSEAKRIYRKMLAARPKLDDEK